MKDKVPIHTTISKSAKIILEKTAGEGGIGDLISKLAVQMQGGALQEIVISDRNILPPSEEKLRIQDDPISILQDGIITGSRTLIGGGTGSGKTTILLNMSAETSLAKPVLLVMSAAKNELERAIKILYFNKAKKLIGNEDHNVVLNLRIMEHNSIFQLIKVLDQYKVLPLVLIDNLEELTNIGSDKFNKEEWKFFKKYLAERKITMVATTGVGKDAVINNSVLDFNSIFYLAQAPVLVNGKSKLNRYVITYKSHVGTINPRQYLLNTGWKVELLNE